MSKAASDKGLSLPPVYDIPPWLGTLLDYGARQAVLELLRQLIHLKVPRVINPDQQPSGSASVKLT